MTLRRSNCLFFAVALYWRRRRKRREGYVVMRQSRWGWFPHFLYLESGRMVSYVPVDPRHKVLPPPIFRGKIRFGDAVPVR